MGILHFDLLNLASVGWQKPGKTPSSLQGENQVMGEGFSQSKEERGCFFKKNLLKYNWFTMC